MFFGGFSNAGMTLLQNILTNTENSENEAGETACRNQETDD